MKEYCKKDWKAMKLEAQPYWYQPEKNGWSLGLFDLGSQDPPQQMHLPFKRDELENDFNAVVKDGESAGRVGDLMLIQLQGDWLAAAERAFRERHKTWCRQIIQNNARRFGHQHDKGTLELGMKEYLQYIAKQTASDRP